MFRAAFAHIGYTYRHGPAFGVDCTKCIRCAYQSHHTLSAVILFGRRDRRSLSLLSLALFPPRRSAALFIYRQFPFILNANCFAKCWANIIRVENAKWIVTRIGDSLPSHSALPVRHRAGRSNMAHEPGCFLFASAIIRSNLYAQTAFAKINTSKEMLVDCIVRARTVPLWKAACCVCVFLLCLGTNKWNRICVNANRCHV